MHLFYQPRIPAGDHFLEPDESRHAVRVLRLNKGSAVRVTDGKGFIYDATITEALSTKCLFKIEQTHRKERRPFGCHIAIAPTKNSDRIEWFVEKAIEFGVERISFVICENSERTSIGLERVGRVAVAAMKQSQQAWLPVIDPPLPFAQAIALDADQKFIAHAGPEQPSLQSAVRPGTRCLVMIGPEGDFSPTELKLATESSFQKVGLGPTRLRTETAGIAAVHIVNLVNAPHFGQSRSNQ